MTDISPEFKPNENLSDLGVLHTQAEIAMEKVFLIGAGNINHVRQYLQTGVNYRKSFVEVHGTGGEMDGEFQIWQRALHGMDGAREGNEGTIYDTIHLLEAERDRAIRQLGENSASNLCARLGVYPDSSPGVQNQPAESTEESTALSFVKFLSRDRALECVAPLPTHSEAATKRQEFLKDKRVNQEELARLYQLAFHETLTHDQN